MICLPAWQPSWWPRMENIFGNEAENVTATADRSLERGVAHVVIVAILKSAEQ